MSLRRPAVLMLALVAVLAGLVVAVDVTVDPPVGAPGAEPDAAAPPGAEADDAAPVDAEADPAEVEPEAGGAWTCAVGDGRDGTEVAVTAIAPDAETEDPARVRFDPFTDGDVEPGQPLTLAPGTGESLPLEGEGTATFARWQDHPVAVFRRWRLTGEEDLPPGRAEGPCLAEDAEQWWIPGMSTAGGHEARVRLANPYETDATVAVRLLTPEGPVEPTVLQNLTVLSRSTTEIEINEHLPERDDVGVDVQVIAGRAAAEGYQLVHQAIGDVDAVSLLAATPRPSTTWTVPWVAEDDDRHSWLWLLNPGDRPAPVELTLHGADGDVAPEGLAEVTVEPGQLRRIDLRGAFPERLSSAALTVRADAEPVIASGTVRLEADEPTDSALPVQLGAQPSDSWVVAGGPTEGRTEQLRLVNPGQETVEVDVALWNGEQTLRPDDLTGVEVDPGALVTLPLAGELGDVEQWGAFVEARDRGQLVVGHVGQGGPDARELVAGPGASSAVWSPAGPTPPSRSEPGLTQRLGTGDDHQRLAPDDDPVVTDDPED